MSSQASAYSAAGAQGGRGVGEGDRPALQRREAAQKQAVLPRKIQMPLPLRLGFYNSQDAGRNPVE